MNRARGQSDFEGSERLVSSIFDERETTASRNLAIAIAAAWRPNAQRIVDIGCGTGEGLVALRSVWPTAHLVGIDPVGEAVDAARATVKGDDKTAIEQLGAADLLSWSGDQFDLAICHLNIGLWPDPEAGVAAIISQLAPGGLLYIVDLAYLDPAGRTQLLGRAQNDAERTYLNHQIDSSMTIDEAQTLTQHIVHSFQHSPHPVTAHCAAGGLAGYAFNSAEALNLWAHEPVQAAIAQLAAPEDGSSADDVIHWVFERG